MLSPKELIETAEHALSGAWAIGRSTGKVDGMNDAITLLEKWATELWLEDSPFAEEIKSFISETLQSRREELEETADEVSAQHRPLEKELYQALETLE